MNSYILFIYASFEDHDELEYFCLEYFIDVSESGVKYVIESLGNCIIIFDSEKPPEELKEGIKKTLTLDHIKFYFLFEKNSIFMADLPDSLSEFIFKPKDSSNFTFTVKSIDKNFDLDELLEKIKNQGIDSLTAEEKNFLDRFGN